MRRRLVAVLALVLCALGVVLLARACAPGTGTQATVAARTTSSGPPPAYATGACRALGATAGRDRGQTVFVDPGHGGPDPGVTVPAAGSAGEARSALAVGTQLASLLRDAGYRVVLSRTGDTSVRRFTAGEVTGGVLSADQVREDLQARVRCADDSGAAALVSIHFNGYTDPSVGGSQTIYDDVRPFADRSRRLASSLQSALLARLHLTDRGVLTDDLLDAPTLSDRADAYGHLLLLGPPQPGWLDRGTSMPGALVEPLFVTAPGEASLAASSTGRRQIALALASGIESFLASPQ